MRELLGRNIAPYLESHAYLMVGNDPEGPPTMTFFSKSSSARRALAGLSLGTAAMLAVTLTGCGSAPTAESQANAQGAQVQEQPNIMMILLDDLGYSDLGSYGGEAETPYIDGLVQESAQFTDFHVSPLCAPTRAALLTGQDPHRVGLGSMEGQSAPGVPLTTPGYKGSLEGEYTGIAEVLGDVGYDTYQVGKWHLGEEEGQTPADLGFDQNFTLYDAGASYFADGHRLFNRDVEPINTVIYEENGEKLDGLPEDFFATRSFTDEMIQMVDQSIESDQPFFGYLAYTAPHDPLHVETKELIDHYLDLYLNDFNYEELRESRIQKMAELGLIDGEVEIRWPAQSPEWDSLTPEQQYDMAYRMAVYAAVIQETDEQIGRVIDHLKETDEYDNTLIVVASDNGAAAATYKNYATLGDIEGWHEEAYPMVDDVESYGLQGSFTSIGFPNAQASSGPYYHAKRTLFEGGIRVPAIMKTPSMDGDSDHRVVDTFAHITDLYPTFADYAGADISSQTHLLGDSAKLFLEGASDSIGDDDFGWELYGHRAYRSGDWKLIFAPESADGPGEYALYNLADDPGETTDVSGDHPDLIAELAEKWDKYAEENGVVAVDFEAVLEAAAPAK